MSGFTLVTLRWYHGGVLDLSSGQLVYSGGQVTKFLDVDVDKLSYFELIGYIKELGYTTTSTFSIKPPNNGILEDIHNDMDILDLSCSLEDGDIVEVYVKHLIDDAVVEPTLILLENVPHGDMEESGSTFNKVNEQNGVGEDHFTTFDTRSASTPTPPTTTSAPRSPSTKTPPSTTAAHRSPSTTTPVTAVNPSTEDADDLVSGPVESDFLEKEGFDYSTEDSVESECGLVGDDDEDYGSDVHEEVRELRTEKRKHNQKGEHSTKRSRGRPPAAPSASPGPAKRSRRRPPIAHAAPNASTSPAKTARGRPLAAASAPPTCPSPANYHVGSSTPADYQLTNSNKGRGRGRGSTTSYKRQAVIGMGVFQDENGFKALNPGMSSCKIFSTGTIKVTKSADVIGDIGYKPSTAPKLKWNGKAAISTRKHQIMFLFLVLVFYCSLTLCEACFTIDYVN
uniref:PB1-like domain-containing protein n=1 Tax=Solanum tuberosum TaxID=4113 RepID=M1AYK3_SOLTU